MSLAEAICAHCLMPFMKEIGQLNRAEREGAPVYCSRQHAGAGKRHDLIPPDAEKKASKAAYDAQYRLDNADALKQKKADYFQRTYDPVKAAIERQKRMPAHVEYCRQPAYRVKKADYDRRRQASKDFGEFAEASLLLQDLEKEVLSRATRYEIGLTNGIINKAQKRRRAL